MLGVNLVFAGFALSLNGIGYRLELDQKAKGFANLLVGIVIGLNAIFQTLQASNHITFGFAAAMWLFALNYFVIAAHTLSGANNWNVFGIYGLFAAIVSLVFAVESIVIGGHWIMIYLWFMWALLWGQSFVAIILKHKGVDKLTPHILIINGIFSTFIPGFLMLLGIIF